MCTVTFMPRKTGYALAMNRDEKLTRPTGLSPTHYRSGERVILCPSEPTGGTWISLNDQGVALALINWYSVPERVAGESVSRGEVVKRTAAALTGNEVNAILTGLALPRVNPFRLIGVFPSAKEIVEWRWNLKEMIFITHRWGLKTWISSGYDESGAQISRGATFEAACLQRSAGSLAWLRRLHRSHRDGRSPYSTCMHRADAASVSYTEISVHRGLKTMRYVAGAPCCGRAANTEAVFRAHDDAIISMPQVKMLKI